MHDKPHRVPRISVVSGRSRYFLIVIAHLITTINDEHPTQCWAIYWRGSASDPRGMCWSPPTFETDPGRCSAVRHEAAFIVAQGVDGPILVCGEPIDRVYLNVSVPMLQTGAGTAHFLPKVRGNPVPSSAGNSWPGSTTALPPITPNASSKPSGLTSRTRCCLSTSMAAASSWPNSSRPARTSTAPKVGSRLFVLPPRRPRWIGYASYCTPLVAGQRQHPRRVLEPLRRRLHGRRRQQRAGRLPELPDSRETSPSPRLENPERVFSKHEGLPLSVPHPPNPHKFFTYGEKLNMIPSKLDRKNNREGKGLDSNVDSARR